jgi:glycosyltransferase involved in cell wall biosynthesis
VPEVWFAVPGDLSTLTGGYIYARRVMAALPAAGWTVHHVALPVRFPEPTDDDLAETRRLLSALPAKASVIIDGLAYGAMTPETVQGLDIRIIALVHHPLALESGVTPVRARVLHASERTMLALSPTVLVPSASTARTLTSDYDIPSTRIIVAEPGTDPGTRAVGTGSVPRLLTVATVTPRKGHDVLMRAFAEMKDLAWFSEIVGSTTRDRAMMQKVQVLIDQHGLASRVVFSGELTDEALSSAYMASDVFVLPSRHEGYGIAFAEALAHGLPVVACDAGAVRNTVPPDASILVPPDDPKALAEALRQIVSDKGLRQRLSDAAWAYGKKLPTWNNTAAAIVRALAL